MTWNELADQFPDFVTWVITNFGPRPEGKFSEEDWDEIDHLYEEFLRG